MGSIGPARVNLTDIRHDTMEQSLLDVVRKSLKPEKGSLPSLPTLLLYDEKGLKIFEEITYLDEYYLTNAEIEALSKYANAIVARIAPGTRLIELGSGNLRKVDILLETFERAQKPIEYYALDVSRSELQRTFSEIDAGNYQYVTFNALHGTYDDALSWLSRPENRTNPVCVMTLGSSLGNFERGEAATFLKGFRDVLGPADWMLVGLDACQNSKRVFEAYNDTRGITERFYRNGLDRANQILGHQVFVQDQWAIQGVYDEDDHRHVASYVALSDVDTKDFAIRKGEKILLEYAYKYSEIQSDQVWHASGLIPQMRYGNDAGDYHLHLLSPSVIEFPENPLEYAAGPVPSLEDWQNLWSAWDTVTNSMIPRDELLNKPIQLRNNLIFYLGHIPTFADIHFTKATGANPTDPACYASIFERGIDPDVDNPESCHDHSEIPDTWPPLDEILDYAHRVRSRILKAIASGEALRDQRLGRGLWLAYEHEAMHLETFLYMLLQSSRVLPPPGAELLDFEALAKEAEQKREKNAWHDIPASKIQIGLDDPEDDLPPARYFGWDNERPARSVIVPRFSAQSRGISNGEYATFLEDTDSNRLPASWAVDPDLPSKSVKNLGDVGTNAFDSPRTETPSDDFLAKKAVRTVYGLVPLKFVLDWPIMASYDELAAYAKWAGGRIPTLEEARSIYSFVENQKNLGMQKTSNALISAVNGHLCNNGVEETPPSSCVLPKSASTDGASNLNAKNVFIDLSGCDVAFKSWHPTPITGEGNRLRGQSDSGGLWEWTSSPLREFEGFKAMDLYPGYTADFFDDKHNVILGGSWATAPRIAGRKSFVNWYQRNYPYTWATARLVKDLE